jgi:hypothetical protein
MFKQDLEVVDALRRDAVQVAEAHTSGIRKIAAYAGQLSWMGAKFPIDVCLLPVDLGRWLTLSRLAQISPGTLPWVTTRTGPSPRITSSSS